MSRSVAKVARTLEHQKSSKKRDPQAPLTSPELEVVKSGDAPEEQAKSPAMIALVMLGMLVAAIVYSMLTSK